jgi:small subunit ribosomal protein S6
LSAPRIYEIVVIIAPGTTEEDLDQLITNLNGIVTAQGGTVTKTEKWGRRHLAYPIGKFKEGYYVVMETEGSGSEIAELERRMRVNDAIVRYMTVRVDLDRRRAEKLKARRVRKAEQRAGGKTPKSAAEREEMMG